MELDAEHRPLVRLLFQAKRAAFQFPSRNLITRETFSSHEEFMEAKMGKGILLWLLGVPIPVIILLWLFFGH